MSNAFRNLRAIAAAAIVVSFSAGSARAETITGLFSTGTNSSDIATGTTGVDQHYTITSAPTGAGSAYIFSSYVGGYYADNSSSQWIGVSAVGTLVEPMGLYVYQTTFTLSGTSPGSVVINGEIGADDSVTMTLNGNAVSIGGTVDFSTPTAFTISSGFVTGVNTLDFMVTNAASQTGLNVEMAGSVVPEPSSIAMCGLAGLVGTGYAWRRRRKAQRAAIA